MAPERLPILGIPPHCVRERVLVCGDPARAEAIARRLRHCEHLSAAREYHSYNGSFNEVPLTVVSHGVGAPGAAVCFEELARAGAREIIRVGTAGSLAPGLVLDGDLVIAEAAVRADGVTSQLIAPEYPAVADHALTARLRRAAERGTRNTACGVVLTIAAFYPGLEPLANDYYSRANVVAVEMEAAALFVIGALRRVATAAVLAIDGVAVEFEAEAYNPNRKVVADAVEEAIELALTAVTA